jgi:hypothetical protein
MASTRLLSVVRVKNRRFRAWETQTVPESVFDVSLHIGLAGILLGEFPTYTMPARRARFA